LGSMGNFVFPKTVFIEGIDLHYRGYSWTMDLGNLYG